MFWQTSSDLGPNGKISVDPLFANRPNSKVNTSDLLAAVDMFNKHITTDFGHAYDAGPNINTTGDDHDPDEILSRCCGHFGDHCWCCYR
jgi:hypothetical protein